MGRRRQRRSGRQRRRGRRPGQQGEGAARRGRQARRQERADRVENGGRVICRSVPGTAGGCVGGSVAGCDGEEASRVPDKLLPFNGWLICLGVPGLLQRGGGSIAGGSSVEVGRRDSFQRLVALPRRACAARTIALQVSGRERRRQRSRRRQGSRLGQPGGAAAGWEGADQLLPRVIDLPGLQRQGGGRAGGGGSAVW